MKSLKDEQSKYPEMKSWYTYKNQKVKFSTFFVNNLYLEQGELNVVKRGS